MVQLALFSRNNADYSGLHPAHWLIWKLAVIFSSALFYKFEFVDYIFAGWTLIYYRMNLKISRADIYVCM